MSSECNTGMTNFFFFFSTCLLKLLQQASPSQHYHRGFVKPLNVSGLGRGVKVNLVDRSLCSVLTEASSVQADCVLKALETRFKAKSALTTTKPGLMSVLL